MLSKIEPNCKFTDFVTTPNVILKINNNPVGLVQELSLTESFKDSKVRIEFQRIMTDEPMDLTEISGGTISITEKRTNAITQYTLRDCIVQEMSKIYKADDYIAVEKYTIVSENYQRAKVNLN